ncbi:hypothetical protein [Naasia lichenicola]|uniref:hypothetical protein n=1 Tax=Naasia lichenicola TaxID=2565933 RepID=UPI00130E90E9|nr:hypothetical protein [Naasia lichenicola]
MTQVKPAGPDYFTWEPSAADQSGQAASPVRTASGDKPTKPKQEKHKHRRGADQGH